MENMMVERVASVATYGGGGVAVVSGLTSHDYGVIIGVFLGFCGLAVQIYRARADIKHKAIMAEQDRSFKEQMLKHNESE